MYRIRFLNSALWVFVFGLLSCQNKNIIAALPYYNTPDFSPIFLQNKSESSNLITHTIPNFSFSDQDKKIVTQQDIEGKIHVANFIFTTCGSICPRLTEEMKLVANAYESDTAVVILSYSVTPWIDSPEKLKIYKETKGITKANWHFLTGNKAIIYNHARTAYFAEEDLGFAKDSSEFLHTEHFVLVDKCKRIRGIYNGTLQLEAEQLIKDIALLKAE